jgi:hypothetical protein
MIEEVIDTEATCSVAVNPGIPGVLLTVAGCTIVLNLDQTVQLIEALEIAEQQLQRAALEPVALKPDAQGSGTVGPGPLSSR